MQINVKNGKTEIKLTVLEKRRLRESASFLEALARHSGGESEAKASEAVKALADKWSEESDEN